MPRPPLASHAGKFVKHVLPAAIKPVHSLWHEVIGFLFMVFAAVASWKMWKLLHAPEAIPAGKLAVTLLVLIPLILVTAGYGISSFLKARRISRS